MNKARVYRVRPRFNGWSLTFTVEYDNEILSERDLQDAVITAGKTRGLGDWRPKYGRLTAEFEAIEIN